MLVTNTYVGAWLTFCVLDHNQPSTPPSSHSSTNDPPEFLSRPDDLSEEEDDYAKGQGSGYQPKKGGYDSRIQQILYENPEMEIIITEAGKSPDGSYIVYRIRTGVLLASTSVKAYILTPSRTSRLRGGIQSSARYAQRWSTCIRL